MNELQELFYRSIDMWLDDSNEEMPVNLFGYLGISQEEYANIFQKPENLFYVFYNNERLQDVILNTLEKTKTKEMYS